MSAIPNHISDKDFKNGVYEFKSFTEIKYPKDYNGQSYLMKLIEIETKDKIAVDTSIKFDMPYTFIDLGLYDNLQQDQRVTHTQASDFAPVAQQLPLATFQGHAAEQTLVRSLRTLDLRGGNVYYLTFNDEQSQALLKAVGQMVGVEEFCIYTQVSIVISKEKT